jgi:hypothetical protein
MAQSAARLPLLNVSKLVTTGMSVLRHVCSEDDRDTMKTLPPNATERLKELGPTLREVTESLKRRNDSLQLHLTESGWTIRRIEPNKPVKTE